MVDYIPLVISMLSHSIQNVIYFLYCVFLYYTLCRARAISLIVSEAFSIVRRLSSLKSYVWLVSVLEVVAIISPIIWFCLWGIPILWFLYGLFSSLYPFWLLLTWSKFLKLGFFFIFGRLPNLLEFWLVWLSVYFIFFKRDEISLVYLVWLWKKRNFSVFVSWHLSFCMFPIFWPFFLAFPISSPGILWFILCWGFCLNLFHSR